MALGRCAHSRRHGHRFVVRSAEPQRSSIRLAVESGSDSFQRGRFTRGSFQNRQLARQNRKPQTILTLRGRQSYVRFKLSFAKLPVLAALILFTGFSLAQTKEVNVSIDATKTGTPISPQIYGQFLEHGGDIVNTGVWA